MTVSEEFIHWKEQCIVFDALNCLNLPRTANVAFLARNRRTIQALLSIIKKHAMKLNRPEVIEDLCFYGLG